MTKAFPGVLAAVASLVLAACAPAAPAAPPPTVPAVTAPKTLGPAAFTYQIVPNANEARFVVNETLAGKTLPNDAVGATKDVTGSLAFTAEGQIVPDKSKITVNVTNITTDRSGREGFIRKNLLVVNQFPEVTFAPMEAKGLKFPLPAAGEMTFELTGNMTVKSVTKPVTWQVKATSAGKEVTGSANTTFQFPLFELEKPSVLAVLSVADDIRLEIDFKVTQNS